MIFSLNNQILVWMNNWAGSSPTISFIVMFVAIYLGWVMVGYLLVYGLVKPQGTVWSSIIFSLISGLVALACAGLLKLIYPLVRPEISLKAIHALFAPSGAASFPSDHAAFFGGIAFFYLNSSDHWGKWMLLICAILVGLGRIAAGVHYPLDVLAGFALALAISWFIYLTKKTH